MNPPMDFEDREMEGAVERLLRRENGHTKTNKDIIDMLLAVHHDSQSRDGTLAVAVQDIVNTAYTNSARISHLEERVESAPDRMRIIAAEAASKHYDTYGATRYGISDPPLGENYLGAGASPDSTTKEGIELLVTWRFGKWILAIILSFAVLFLMNYGADRLASGQAESNEQKTELHISPSYLPLTLPEVVP